MLGGGDVNNDARTSVTRLIARRYSGYASASAALNGRMVARAPPWIVVERQRAAVERRSEDVGVRPQELDPATLQPHVPSDIGPEQDMVRERWRAEARMHFARDRPAADRLTALEHERLQTRFRQVERGGQTVVPRSDDDNVVRHFAQDGVRSCLLSPSQFSVARTTESQRHREKPPGRLCASVSLWPVSLKRLG